MGFFDSIGSFIENKVILPVANVIGSTINLVAGKTVYTPNPNTFQTPIGKVYTNILGASATSVAGALAIETGVAKTQALRVYNYATSGVIPLVKTVGVAGVVGGGGLSILPALYNFTKTETQKALPVITGNEPLSKQNIGGTATVIGEAVGLGALGYVGGKVASGLYDKVTGQSSAPSNSPLPASTTPSNNAPGVEAPQPTEVAPPGNSKPKKKHKKKKKAKKTRRSKKKKVNKRNKRKK